MYLLNFEANSQPSLRILSLQDSPRPRMLALPLHNQQSLLLDSLTVPFIVPPPHSLHSGQLLSVCDLSPNSAIFSVLTDSNLSFNPSTILKNFYLNNFTFFSNWRVSLWFFSALACCGFSSFQSNHVQQGH